MTDFEAQSGHKKGQLRLSAAGAVAELQLLSSIRSILMAETGWEAVIADYGCRWQLHPENGHWIPVAFEEK